MSLEGSEKDQRHELQAVKLDEAQLDEDTQLQPSAKALGKRRVIETPELARESIQIMVCVLSFTSCRAGSTREIS
jgi:hypothetical protein